MDIKEPIANADFEVTLNTYKHETINRYNKKTPLIKLKSLDFEAINY